MLNPAAADIFGYAADELIGQPITCLFALPYRDSHYRNLISMLQANPGLEVVGQRRDNTLFSMYFGISELYLGHRRIYTCIVQDLTERKRMEAELLEKERIQFALAKEREMREYKNRFISLMSHELRTPLSSIRLSGDMLKLYNDKIDEEERLMYLQNIATQVEHLAMLVKDMLVMSRSEISEIDFAPVMIDFLALCRQIVNEYQVIYHATHQITFVSDATRLDAKLDPKLVRQFLTNLITNAVKYSPDGDDVQVVVRHDEQHIYLSISDEGIGIPEADIPLLFEAFHRASNTNKLPGTGLGLTVVKQAVEMHGGAVEISSKLGQGTTFYVTLPISAP
jgi:PAS domain S-box-containing protein